MEKNRVLTERYNPCLQESIPFSTLVILNVRSRPQQERIWYMNFLNPTIRSSMKIQKRSYLDMRGSRYDFKRILTDLKNLNWSILCCANGIPNSNRPIASSFKELKDGSYVFCLKKRYTFMSWTGPVRNNSMRMCRWIHSRMTRL